MNEGQADTPPERQFRVRVDEAHCDRAARGLGLMARYQYRSQVRRYEQGALGGMRRVLRRVAPVIGGLLLVLGVLALPMFRADGSSGFFWSCLSAVFFLEAAVFLLLPFWADRATAGMRAWFEGVFARRAARSMDRTRREVPFEAIYDLRGDLLTYSRQRHGQWTGRWHRQLGKLRPRGVALRAPGLIAFFARPGAAFPAITVLTADDDAMAAAIRALGWTLQDIDPVSGELVAPASGEGTTAGD